MAWSEEASLTLLDAKVLYNSVLFFTLERPDPTYCGPKVFGLCVEAVDMLAHGVPVLLRARVSDGGKSINSVISLRPATVLALVEGAKERSQYVATPVRGVMFKLEGARGTYYLTGGSLSFRRLADYLRYYRRESITIGVLFPGGSPPEVGRNVEGLYFTPVDVEPLPGELKYAMLVDSILDEVRSRATPRS